MPTNYDFIGANSAKLMSAKVTIDPASGLFASADVAYSAWCNELAIDPATSLGAYDADDSSFYFASSVPLNPAKDVIFKAHHMISSEGAIGFYDNDPTNTGAISVSIPNISRMYQTAENPCLFLTYHAAGVDHRTYNSKWNKSANGFCIRTDQSHYGGGSSIFKVAIQVTPKKIRLFIENVSAGAIPIFMNTFTGGGSTIKTVINQYNLGSTGGNGTLSYIELDYNSVTYKGSGNSLFNVPLSTITGIHGSCVDWTADTPAGTTVNVKAAVNSSGTTPPSAGDFDAVANGGSISDLIDGMSTNGMFLWIKVELATSDNTKTPSLTALSVSINDDLCLRQFTIHLTNTGRLRHPQGDVTVAYAASQGNLKNAAGTLSVASFTLQTNPDEAKLSLFFNPNDPENISVSPAITVLDVNQVNFVDSKTVDEQITVGSISISAAVYDTLNNQV